jgi:putative CocE/NonD family hydrolase
LREGISAYARAAVLFAAALASATFSGTHSARALAPHQVPDGPCKFVRQSNVPAMMRDGSTLLADVYIPVAEGTFPVLLMRLPHNKESAQTYVYGSPAWYASQCYIVAIQDVRGTYASTGDFYPFRDELNDGYDSVEWAAGLPQSNGKVGMYGFSYVGATQWLAAIQAPPHLAAIAPAMTSSDYYDGWAYEGGAFALAFDESWPVSDLAPVAARRSGVQALVEQLDKAKALLHAHYSYLPIRGYPWLFPDKPQIAGYFYDWVDHPTWDAYWKQWSPRLHYADVKVPALNESGWYDVFLNGAIENFVGMRKEGGSPEARAGQRLVIGPYIHLPWERKTGEVDFGAAADNRADERQLRFFDHWLKGEPNGLETDPPVQVFVMGANAWRGATDWPIPGTKFTKYYLRSYGEANSSGGNGMLTTERPPLEPADHFTYDPADPVPSKGGHSCCFANLAPLGPYDQSELEKRADVLVYSTPPLDKPVEVTGPITLTLYAASSAEDTDWTAKLVDVYPDGRAINLNNGIIRARYRDSLEHPDPITPDTVYRYTIAIWPTSNLFRVGHRIRLEVSSSNFPQYDRNPNTGDRFGTDARLVTASQRVYHDRRRPSALVLPIMPEPVAPAQTASAGQR